MECNEVISHVCMEWLSSISRDCLSPQNQEGADVMVYAGVHSIYSYCLISLSKSRLKNSGKSVYLGLSQCNLTGGGGRDVSEH